MKDLSLSYANTNVNVWIRNLHQNNIPLKTTFTEGIQHHQQNSESLMFAIIKTMMKIFTEAGLTIMILLPKEMNNGTVLQIEIEQGI